MLVKTAMIRVAKIRNDVCYSNENLIKLNKDNKENNMGTSYQVDWFEIR